MLRTVPPKVEERSPPGKDTGRPTTPPLLDIEYEPQFRYFERRMRAWIESPRIMEEHPSYNPTDDPSCQPSCAHGVYIITKNTVGILN